jgi:hypothetical protein
MRDAELVAARTRCCRPGTGQATGSRPRSVTAARWSCPVQARAQRRNSRHQHELERNAEGDLGKRPRVWNFQGHPIGSQE